MIAAAACGSPAVRPSISNRPAPGTPSEVQPAPEPAELSAPAGRAELVVQSTSGGVLALRGDRDAALDSAHAQMSDHCTDFQIVREGEEVIGHDTISGANPMTVVATEWRVYYQCTLP